jgi:hypothetical protein
MGNKHAPSKANTNSQTTQPEIAPVAADFIIDPSLLTTYVTPYCTHPLRFGHFGLQRVRYNLKLSDKFPGGIG